MRRAASSLFALVFLAGSQAAPENRDEPAFRQSMELLEVQMKLKLLESLHGKGYYIPPDWVASYVKEQHKLAEELGLASGRDLQGMDAWAREAGKTRKAEADAFLKFADKWVKEAVKKGKELDSIYLNFQLKCQALPRDKAIQAAEIALFVEEAAAQFKDRTRGTEWEKTAREIYRGALGDRKRIFDGISALEKDRMRIEGCLVCLREIDKYMKTVKDLQSLQTPRKTVVEKAGEQVEACLKSGFGDGDKIREANIKWTMKHTTSLVNGAFDTWDKLSGLDDDRILKANPEALKTVKGCAVLGALCKNTLAIVKDCPAAAAFGPAACFIEFYGEAISLIPEAAKKMQAMVTKMDQGYLGFRKLGAFGQLPEGLGPFWEASLQKHFGIRIASGHDLMEGAEEARFFLIVPKEQATRGYAEFTREQYGRLAQALADERVLFAADEVSRSIWGTAMDGLYGSKPDSPLAHAVQMDQTYRTDLAKAASTTPFKEKDLQNLALGLPATCQGREWTAGQLRDRCESRMDILVEEMAVREALSEYSTAHRESWREFKKTLEASGVVLAPEQILKLFNHHVQGGGTRVQAYLDKLRAERKEKNAGSLKLGMPDCVYLQGAPGDSTRDSLAPGERATASVDCVASDLAPGASVEATVSWELPAWAQGAPSQTLVRLVNGLNTLTCSFTVPGKPPAVSIEIRATLKVPAGPGCSTAIEKKASGTFEIVDKPAIIGTKVVEGETRILFRSNALAALREKPIPDNMVYYYYRLYRAKSPEGPWERSGDPVHIRSDKADDPKDPSFVMLRAGQQGDPSDKDPGRPSLYRIADLGPSPDPSRPEIVSDPTPTPVPRLAFRLETQRDWSQEDAVTVEGNDPQPKPCSFCFCLVPTVEDQVFSYPDTPIEAKWQGKVWHGWTRPPASSRQDLPYLRLPCRFGTHPLQLSAKLPDGTSFSRTIQVTFNPAWARQAEAIATQPPETDEVLMRIREIEKGNAQVVIETQAQLAKLHSGTQRDPVWTAKEIAECEWRIEISGRRGPEECQEKIVCDWMNLRIKTLRDANRFSEALAMRLNQAAKFPQVLAQQLAWEDRLRSHGWYKTDADLQEAIRGVRFFFYHNYSDVLASGLSEATDAGDYPALRYFAAEMERLDGEMLQYGFSDARKSAERRKNLFYFFYQGTAVSGGDRERAADLWLQYQVEKAKYQEEDPVAKLKEVLAESYSSRPQWWPPGKKAAKPVPPISAGDLATLRQAVTTDPQTSAPQRAPAPDPMPPAPRTEPPKPVTPPPVPPPSRPVVKPADLPSREECVKRARDRWVKGEYEQAVADYRLALTLPGTQADATPEILGMELAEALIHAGHPKEALKELDALAARPGMAQNASVMALKGMAALKSGNRMGGYQQLAQAASADAELAKRWYEAIPGMTASGQYERSLLYYDAVDVMQPGFAGIHFGRGQVYALMGRKAEAIAAYKLYLQADATSAWAEQARKEIATLQR